MDIELREGDVIEDVLRSRIERLKLKEPFTTAQVGSILSIRRERVNNLLWGNPPRLQASRVPTGRSQSIRCTITFHDLLKYMEENDPRIAIRERQYRVSEAIGEERLEAEYARLMKLTNDLGFHEPLTVQEVAKLFGKSLPRVYEAARSYGPTRLLPWFDPTPAIFGKTVYRFWLRGVAFYACIAHLDERERHEASRRKKFD
ncbi:MAG: hypothetical protein L6Q71_11500, partial [Planctomycetes bacterium]|nr:hypothetical protein [Planctomycetota bacterium]